VQSPRFPGGFIFDLESGFTRAQRFALSMLDAYPVLTAEFLPEEDRYFYFKALGGWQSGYGPGIGLSAEYRDYESGIFVDESTLLFSPKRDGGLHTNLTIETPLNLISGLEASLDFQWNVLGPASTLMDLEAELLYESPTFGFGFATSLESSLYASDPAFPLPKWNMEAYYAISPGFRISAGVDDLMQPIFLEDGRQTPWGLYDPGFLAHIDVNIAF
jgi:hypothetical protein